MDGSDFEISAQAWVQSSYPTRNRGAIICRGAGKRGESRGTCWGAGNCGADGFSILIPVSAPMLRVTDDLDVGLVCCTLVYWQ